MEQRRPGSHCCNPLLLLLSKHSHGVAYFCPKQSPLKLMPLLQLCCLLCLKPRPGAVCGSLKYLLLSASREFSTVVPVAKRPWLLWLCNQLSSRWRAPLAGHRRRAPLAVELLRCCLGCRWLGLLRCWLQLGSRLGSRLGSWLGSQLGSWLGSWLGRWLSSRLGSRLGSRFGSRLECCILTMPAPSVLAPLVRTASCRIKGAALPGSHPGRPTELNTWCSLPVVLLPSVDLASPDMAALNSSTSVRLQRVQHGFCGLRILLCGNFPALGWGGLGIGPCSVW